MQIDDPGQPIGRDQVVAITRHAAMPDVPMATFSSDNRMLNAVWRLTARSCLYCSHEQFVDTPTREKGQFVWDAANESEAVMRAYGDQNMSWQGLRDVARGQARYWPDGRVNSVYPNGDGARDYATFTARYPEWLWRYYVSTGDQDTAVRLYPSVSRVAGWLWSARQGEHRAALRPGRHQQRRSRLRLRPLGGGGHGEQRPRRQRLQPGGPAGGPRRGRGRRGGPAGTGRPADGGGQLPSCDDPTVSTWTASTPTARRAAHASQEANALALAYGVVPAADVATVGAYVAGLGIDLAPNHGLELLRALAAADMTEAMVHTLTDASVPGWAHIVAGGGTFTWEMWQPSDLIGDSMSHGWGSSALVAMQETLLGVSLLEPNPDGTVRLSVAPPTGGLSRASGSVPTSPGRSRCRGSADPGAWPSS